MLANDTSEDIKTCAAGIVEASHSSHSSAPPAAHEHIAKVVQANPPATRTEPIVKFLVPGATRYFTLATQNQGKHK